MIELNIELDRAQTTMRESVATDEIGGQTIVVKRIFSLETRVDEAGLQRFIEPFKRGEMINVCWAGHVIPVCVRGIDQEGHVYTVYLQGARFTHEHPQYVQAESPRRAGACARRGRQSGPAHPAARRDRGR